MKTKNILLNSGKSVKWKLLVASAVLYFGFTSLSSAQTDNRFGVMLAYGTEIENVGLGINADFPVAEHLTIAPSFIYYFPKDYPGGDMNWWELNADANYYFVENEGIGFYGLAGLNYSHVSVDFDTAMGSMESSNGEFGLNLGVGANFNIQSSITPFAQLKYVIIDGSQLVVSAGVRFRL